MRLPIRKYMEPHSVTPVPRLLTTRRFLPFSNIGVTDQSHTDNLDATFCSDTSTLKATVGIGVFIPCVSVYDLQTVESQFHGPAVRRTVLRGLDIPRP